MDREPVQKTSNNGIGHPLKTAFKKHLKPAFQQRMRTVKNTLEQRGRNLIKTFKKGIGTFKAALNKV